ncbi:MAG: DUF4278 domain-containing protein [Cyanobacteria bacterium P01_A01_bin.68]
MKLTYRGIKYEQAPTAVEVTETEVSGEILDGVGFRPIKLLNPKGKYRGVEWKRHQFPHLPIHHHAAELKYRGASYYCGTPEEVEELKQRKKLNFILKKSSNLFPRKQPINNKLAEIHSMNLCRDLQRRLQLAKLQGDEKLIRMLEDEANQLSVEDCQLSFDDF